jgi:hypothetical protein
VRSVLCWESIPLLEDVIHFLGSYGGAVRKQPANLFAEASETMKGSTRSHTSECKARAGRSFRKMEIILENIVVTGPCPFLYLATDIS